MLDTTVEVMQLNGQARTGLVEVNSNEDERTPLMGAIHRNVFALEHAHVIGHIIDVSFTVRSSAHAYRIGLRRKPSKVGNHVWLDGAENVHPT